MARKQYFTTEGVPHELKMDSDSDMEPEEDDFCQMEVILLLKVVLKLCQVNQCIFCQKGLESIYSIIPLLDMAIFCYHNHDNSKVNNTKTNFRVYTFNMQSFTTIHSKTNTQCFSECDYPVCVQTSPGSHRPVQSGTGVQKGLNVTPVCVI